MTYQESETSLKALLPEASSNGHNRVRPVYAFKGENLQPASMLANFPYVLAFLFHNRRNSGNLGLQTFRLEFARTHMSQG